MSTGLPWIRKGMSMVKHDWKKLDPRIRRLAAEGMTQKDVARDLRMSPSTLEHHLKVLDEAGTPIHFKGQRTQAKKAHLGTPEEHLDTSEVHPSIPDPTEILPDKQYTQEHLDTLQDPDHTEVHPGTLEGHQEVMEDVYESVPDAPHISTEEPYQNTPEHLGTPEVHPELSPLHSGVPLEYSGVPARHEQLISTPMVHPGTPTADDWELWNIIRGRWAEVEKMLADRQVLLSTPLGTPGHTQKKTYVFDVRHIALIDRYSRDHRLDLKDVLYAAFEEFFERRGYREINQ